MTAKDAKPGDHVWTDFAGYWQRVRITERLIMRSQTGVCFRTIPSVSKYDWPVDSAWFRMERPKSEDLP